MVETGCQAWSSLGMAGKRRMSSPTPHLSRGPAIHHGHHPCCQSLGQNPRVITNRVAGMVGMVLSRTQVTTSDITQLVKEIRDMKQDQKSSNVGGPINKLEALSKHLNNTPDLDRGKHGERDLDDAETDYSKLCPSLPIDGPDTQTHRDEVWTPGPNTPSQKPPAPSPGRTPSASSAKTSSLPSEDVGSDPEASLSDERTASDSPDSPNEIKASSRARK